MALPDYSLAYSSACIFMLSLTQKGESQNIQGQKWEELHRPKLGETNDVSG